MTRARLKKVPGHRQLSQRMDHQDSYGCRGCSTAITFAPLAGNAHLAPEERELLRVLGLFPGMPVIMDRSYEGNSRFEKLDYVFLGYLSFALIVEGLR
jgi:hypothetical protein